MIFEGCVGTAHLKDNEQRLLRQKIRIQLDRSTGKDQSTPAFDVSSKELKDHLAQTENKAIPGTRLSPAIALRRIGKLFYNRDRRERKLHRVERKLDEKITETTSQRKTNTLQYKKQQRTAKLERRIDKQWGQSVVIFDSSLVSRSEENIHAFLFSRGYFLSKTSAVVKTAKHANKLVGVTYHVHPGPAYVIDSIFYRVNDTGIDSLLLKSRGESTIVKGQVYDEKDISAERDRIDLLLKDYGYYDFTRQYIEFNIDTTFRGVQHVAVMIDINDPVRGSHRVFKVDSVLFTTDASVNFPGTKRQHMRYQDITFRFFENEYSPKILSQRVFIHPGMPYSRSRTFDTQRQLANLDAFRFVNINYDTSGGKFITNIFTSPLNRYEWSNEVGVNVTEGYPGPFYNINLKKRNLFGGLENFDFNGRIGLEGVASATQSQNVYKSLEGSLNGTITFPQFIFPLSREAQVRFGRYNPRTKAQIGYSYTNRPEYSRANTNASFTYLWETHRTTQMFLTLTNLNVINTTIKTDQFQAFLTNQENLGNKSLASSFRPSFVSSMVFGITWNHNNYGNREENSTYIRAQVESGGTTLNFIKTENILKQDLEYFKFLRFSFDFRQNIILGKSTLFAYRFNSGIAYPYSQNNTLPYEKFFFSGGSSSVRAWRPRRLGPGSLPPPLSGDPVNDGYFDYSFESPGEILLEGSAELRQDLFSIVKAGVFVDAGNTWWFNDLPGPAGINYGSSKFSLSRFYKEFGVGTGFGIRFDFTFLILRFDVGIKVYDPARPSGSRFVLDDLRFLRPFGLEKEPVIYNVAIGYPF